MRRIWYHIWLAYGENGQERLSSRQITDQTTKLPRSEAHPNPGSYRRLAWEHGHSDRYSVAEISNKPSAYLKMSDYVPLDEKYDKDYARITEAFSSMCLHVVCLYIRQSRDSETHSHWRNLMAVKDQRKQLASLQLYVQNMTTLLGYT